MYRKIITIIFIFSFVSTNITAPLYSYTCYDNLRPMSVKCSSAGKDEIIGAIYRGDRLLNEIVDGVLNSSDTTELPPITIGMLRGAINIIVTTSVLHDLWKRHMQARLNDIKQQWEKELAFLKLKKEQRILGCIIPQDIIDDLTKKIETLPQQESLLSTNKITKFQPLQQMLIDAVGSYKIVEFEPKADDLKKLVKSKDQNVVALVKSGQPPSVFILKDLVNTLLNEGPEGTRKVLALFGHALLDKQLLKMGVDPIITHILAEDFERFICASGNPDNLSGMLSSPQSPLDESIWNLCEDKLNRARQAIPKAPEAPELQAVAVEITPSRPQTPPKKPSIPPKLPKGQPAEEIKEKTWQCILDAYKALFTKNLSLPSYKSIADKVDEDEAKKEGYIPLGKDRVRRIVNIKRQELNNPLFLLTRGSGYHIKFSSDKQIEEDWELLCKLHHPYEAPVKVAKFAKVYNTIYDNAKQRLDTINATLKTYGLPVLTLSDEDSIAAATITLQGPLTAEKLREYDTILRVYYAIIQTKKSKVEKLWVEYGASKEKWIAENSKFDGERMLFPSQEEMSKVLGMNLSKTRLLLKEINENLAQTKQKQLETIGPGAGPILNLLGIDDPQSVRDLFPYLNVKIKIIEEKPKVPAKQPATVRDGAMDEGISDIDRDKIAPKVSSLLSNLMLDPGNLWRFAYLFLSPEQWQLYTETLAKIQSQEISSLDEKPISPPLLDETEALKAYDIYKTLDRNFLLINILAFCYLDIKPDTGKQGYEVSVEQLEIIVDNQDFLDILADMNSVFSKENRQLLAAQLINSGILKKEDSNNFKKELSSISKSQARITSNLFEQIAALCINIKQLLPIQIISEPEKFLELANGFLTKAKEKKGLLEVEAIRALHSIEEGQLILTVSMARKSETIKQAIVKMLPDESSAAALLISLVQSNILSLNKAVALAAIISRDDIDLDNKDDLLKKVSQQTERDASDLDKLIYGRAVKDAQKRKRVPTAIVLKFYNYISQIATSLQELKKVSELGLNENDLADLSLVIDDAVGNGLIQSQTADTLKDVAPLPNLLSEARASQNDRLKVELLHAAFRLMNDYSNISAIIRRVMELIPEDKKSKLKNIIAARQITTTVYIDRLKDFLSAGGSKVSSDDILILALHYGVILSDGRVIVPPVRIETEQEVTERIRLLKPTLVEYAIMFFCSEYHNYENWQSFIGALSVDFVVLRSDTTMEAAEIESLLLEKGITETEFLLAKAYWKALSSVPDNTIVSVEYMCLNNQMPPDLSMDQISASVSSLNALEGFKIVDNVDIYLNGYITNALADAYVDHSPDVSWRSFVQGLADSISEHINRVRDVNEIKGRVLNTLRANEITERDFVNLENLKGEVTKFLQPYNLRQFKRIQEVLTAYNKIFAHIESFDVREEILRELGLNESDIIILWAYHHNPALQKGLLPTLSDINESLKTHGYSQLYNINETLDKLQKEPFYLSLPVKSNAVNNIRVPDKQQPTYPDLFKQLGIPLSKGVVPNVGAIEEFFQQLPQQQRMPDRHNAIYTAYKLLTSKGQRIKPIGKKGPLLTGAEYRRWYSETHLKAGGIPQANNITSAEQPPIQVVNVQMFFDSAA